MPDGGTAGHLWAALSRCAMVWTPRDLTPPTAQKALVGVAARRFSLRSVVSPSADHRSALRGCHAAKRSGRSVAFPTTRAGVRALRPSPRPRDRPSALTARFSALRGCHAAKPHVARSASVRLSLVFKSLRDFPLGLASLHRRSHSASPCFYSIS